MKIPKYCCFILHPFRTSFEVLATEHFCFPPLLAGQEGFQFLDFLPLYKKNPKNKEHEKRKKKSKKKE